VRVTRCSLTCRTAAPRSRRSRCADSGSMRRPSTNESGSSPSNRPIELECLLETAPRATPAPADPCLRHARDVATRRPYSQAAPPLHPAAATQTRQAFEAPTVGASIADRSTRSGRSKRSRRLKAARAAKKPASLLRSQNQ
jgi:hypothetical protein